MSSIKDLKNLSFDSAPKGRPFPDVCRIFVQTFAWAEIETWNQERNRLMARLEKDGISVRQGTHAVHTLGYYKKRYGLNDYDYPMSYIADRLSITLPLYCGMTEKDQVRVVSTFERLIQRSGHNRHGASLS